MGGTRLHCKRIGTDSGMYHSIGGMWKFVIKFHIPFAHVNCHRPICSLHKWAPNETCDRTDCRSRASSFDYPMLGNLTKGESHVPSTHRFTGRVGSRAS